MKFQIDEQCCKGIPVRKLKGRAIFKHGDSWYRRVDSVGQGITLDHSGGHVVIVNLKIGTLREIPGNIHVEIYEPCPDHTLMLRPVSFEDRHFYLI